jgi:hypothetical protein
MLQSINRGAECSRVVVSWESVSAEQNRESKQSGQSGIEAVCFAE